MMIFDAHTYRARRFCHLVSLRRYSWIHDQFIQQLCVGGWTSARQEKARSQKRSNRSQVVDNEVIDKSQEIILAKQSHVHLLEGVRYMSDQNRVLTESGEANPNLEKLALVPSYHPTVPTIRI